MAQLYYTYQVVFGTANTETVLTAVTSTEEEKKKVVDLFIYECTGTIQNDAIIRVYVERERIAELPIRMFTDNTTNHVYPNGAGRLPLNVDLPVGQSLKVGHLSGGTASNLVFVIVYEIAE